MLQFSASINRFRPLNRSRRKLPLPAASAVRVAEVSASATSFDSAESFYRDRWDQLEAFRPGVLVGSAPDLRALAELAERRIVDLTSVDYAIFVLTECGNPPLSDITRVVLWQAFGVPVYELFASAGGTLLASECEAHEGWHVEPCATFSKVDGEFVLDAPGLRGAPTGLSGRIALELCPCGRRGMRVTNIEALAAPAACRELAATA